MNKQGHPATLTASQPGNKNARTHGILAEDEIAKEATRVAEQLLDAYERTARVEVLAWEAARMMALANRIDAWLASLGDQPPKTSQRYLLDIRSRIAGRLTKTLQLLDEAGRRDSPAQPTLDGEHADYVAELQRIALRTPSATPTEKLRALSLLLDLGTKGTTAGALAEDEYRREGALTGEHHGRRHVRSAAGWKRTPGDK